MTSAPDALVELIERFSRNIDGCDVGTARVKRTGATFKPVPYEIKVS